MEKKENPSFSTALKKLREIYGLTQAQIAKIVNKVDSTVRMWELRKSEPDHETLRILARYFNVSIDYLLGLEDEIIIPKLDSADRSTKKNLVLQESSNELTQISNPKLSFINEFNPLFSDKSYIKLSRLFKAADNTLRNDITVFLEGMMFKAGYDTRKIINL